MPFFDKPSGDVFDHLERIVNGDTGVDHISNPSVAVAVSEDGQIILRFNKAHYVMGKGKALRLAKMIEKKAAEQDA